MEETEEEEERKKKKEDEEEEEEKSSSSNWILVSYQPHRVTSGQSDSGHKQIYVSKLFLHIYQPSVKSV